MGDFEELVLATARQIEPLIPVAPAADLGRYEPRHHWNGPEFGTPAQRALDDFDRSAAELLLGALERGVSKLTVQAPDDIVADLVPLPAGTTFSYASFGGQSPLEKPMGLIAIVNPGAIELITEQVRATAALVDLGDVTGDENAVIAKHGAAHLAVAVATAAAVLNKIRTSPDPVAVIGIAIGVTALVIPKLPKPPAYEQALRQRMRDEYQGQSWNPSVPVAHHQFQLIEDPGDSPGFSATGLVAALETGFAVRTGIEQGRVPVEAQVVLTPPGEPETTYWDEVAEVSFTAVNGGAQLGCAGMPPWPDDYRVRVSACGRDGDDDEAYELLIWPAPLTEPVVHKKTDRLGHRLRGEPEPIRPPAPEAGLRWLANALGEAATVTIAIGLEVDDVVDDFDEDSIAIGIDGGVVVIEDNNYVGADENVLAQMSRNGKAASFYWNVNAVTMLSFARKGELVSSEEPWEDAEFGDDPEVVAALDGLDFVDVRHTYAKGITAVTRFTGGVLPKDDITAAIEALYE
ncbi:hypothetical protein UK23_05715 [Lentzea aerocolonigenes]|uniref:Uncharacterized protein n=1 Tax=Lentzea aerocolonigenes TaxID=68170 RepID=A0A0F0HDS3_LENAE|nr:DUF6461 domain-containing protein [Lentzea aerocolonigenes]KJK51803.1 hypothetical protein UK23_05715 [Lentzea aerocolonigenes]